MHFERRNAFKMHKIIYFCPEKKIQRINMSVYPRNLKLSEPLPKTHLFFYLAFKHTARYLFEFFMEILNFLSCLL